MPTESDQHLKPRLAVARCSTPMNRLLSCRVFFLPEPLKNAAMFPLWHAIYDQGSAGCFISEDVLDMGATNTDTVLQLKTMHGNNFVRTKAVEGLKVADISDKTSSLSEIPVVNKQTQCTKTRHSTSMVASTWNRFRYSWIHGRFPSWPLIGSIVPRPWNPWR